MEDQNEKIKELATKIEQMEKQLKNLEDLIEDIQYEVTSISSVLINNRLE